MQFSPGRKTTNISHFLVTLASPPSLLPLTSSSPVADNSFYSPTNHSMQPFRKNFQCRMCRLTYKVNSFRSQFSTLPTIISFRISMIAPHIFGKNTKLAMHKLVVMWKNSIPMLRYLHLPQEITNFA